MRLFQIIQKHLATIGIDPNSAMQLRLFNEKPLMCLLALGLGIIFMLMFILNEAETSPIYAIHSFVLSIHSRSAHFAASYLQNE